MKLTKSSNNIKMAKKKDSGQMNLNAFKDVRKDSGRKGKIHEFHGNLNDETHVEDPNPLMAALSDALAGLLPEISEIPGISKEDKARVMFQMLLAQLGVTPDEYEATYHMFGAVSNIMEAKGLDADNVDEMDFDFPLFGRRGSGKPVTAYEPMADAADKTLVLKIQMKGVTKPPMWREIEIPADFNFRQLHKAIQAVTGLDDSHLWQFNKTAYDDTLQIGVERDEDNSFGFGIDHVTDDAESTPITKYLAQKGDELEYTYDFGDDWIFTVKVQKVIDSPCETPKCVKWKSDLNALEDIGGPYSYEELRVLADKDAKLSKAQVKKLFEQYGGWYDSQQEFLEWIDSEKFDPVAASERLSEI